MLQAFHLGELSDEDIERVADHAGSCDRCTSDLDSNLTVDVPLAGRLQNATIAPDYPDEEARRKLGLRLAEIRLGLPATIGPWFVIRQLGLGGLASVYLVKRNDDDQHRALKIPRPDRVLSQNRYETFLSEARAVRRHSV